MIKKLLRKKKQIEKTPQTKQPLAIETSKKISSNLSYGSSDKTVRRKSYKYMKLLIIEDEEILVRVLREKFEKTGAQVLVEMNGDKALSVVKRYKPDIILLDIVLPNKDGLEILSELKADSELKNIPVVIMSNIEEDERVSEALKLGALEYIMKVQHPIDEIVEKVMQHVLKAR